MATETRGSPSAASSHARIATLGDDEQLGEVGGGERREHLGIGGRRLDDERGLLPLADGLGVACLLERLGDGLARGEQRGEARHERIGLGALRQPGREILGGGPAGKLDAHGTAGAVARGLGIVLPHLVAGERQDRAHHANHDLEDAVKHRLRAATRG